MTSDNERSDKLPYGEVQHILGQALFGEQWRNVATLTEHERWLVESLSSRSSLPSGVTFVGYDYMNSPDREYRNARKKYEFRKHLTEQIDEWLDERGVDVGDDGWVDRAEFEAAYAAAFPRPANSADRRSPAPAAVRAEFQLFADKTKGVITEEVVTRAMDARFGEGQVSRETIRQLIKTLPGSRRAPAHRPPKPRPA